MPAKLIADVTGSMAQRFLESNPQRDFGSSNLVIYKGLLEWTSASEGRNLYFPRGLRLGATGYRGHPRLGVSGPLHERG